MTTNARLERLLRDSADTNRMLLRRRLLERAHSKLEDSDTEGALADALAAMDEIQGNDESVLELHRECLRMVEFAQKAISMVMEQRSAVAKE